MNEATLLWSFEDNVDRLWETTVELEALMHDADRRSSQDQGEIVGVWMKKFKSVAYDVEDLLDEFEAIELVMQNQSKKVKKDVDIIKEEGHRLHLVPDYNTPRSAEGCTDQATVAWTNEDIDTGMIGRDTQKENVIKLLLKSEAEEHISIIPIVGLGGLGKTTLAQAVFSDMRAKIFDLRVWVFVSKNLDLPRIGEIILSNASRSTGSETSERYITPKNGDLQSIIEQLKSILPTKRYLIVLDDMWEECVSNLEMLKQMLQHGGKVSKVILTTRMQRVVENLDAGVLAHRRIICPVHKSDQINLSFLSVEDCWNVIRQTALGRGDDGVSGLEEIGREIVVKCRGLLLLACSLGYLLSQNKSTEAWEDIRARKVILGMAEAHQPPETLESLMLSYYYMPFKVKLCFTYCAIFPKSFSIASDHLIQQWRALGYIQSIDGRHCINYMLGMSFLQISRALQSSQQSHHA